MSDSFFTTTDNQRFQPTSHTRGPWDENHCHAGPPTGLMARAAEIQLPDQQLVRLSINLQRPIPYSGFTVTAEVAKKGRMVSLCNSRLLDDDGKLCASAETLHVTRQPEFEVTTTRLDVPLPEDGRAGDFPINRTLHDLPSFTGDGVETRYAPGSTPDPGPTTAWIRTVDLLPDETPSPFQRMCPMADCGNAFSRNAEPWEINFMNPDLTIVMFREPQGEWMGSQSTGHWETSGIGMADAQLLDQHGVVGRAVQTLLLRPTDSMR